MKKMIRMIQENRLYIALALLAQSIAFFFVFLFLCFKKKSIAAAFLAVSAAEGGAAAYLLYQCKDDVSEEYDAVREALEAEEEFDLADISCEDEEEPVVPKKAVPCEEHVSEDEFQ